MIEKLVISLCRGDKVIRTLLIQPPNQLFEYPKKSYLSSSYCQKYLPYFISYFQYQTVLALRVIWPKSTPVHALHGIRDIGRVGDCCGVHDGVTWWKLVKGSSLVAFRRWPVDFPFCLCSDLRGFTEIFMAILKALVRWPLTRSQRSWVRVYP